MQKIDSCFLSFLSLEKLTSCLLRFFSLQKIKFHVFGAFLSLQKLNPWKICSRRSFTAMKIYINFFKIILNCKSLVHESNLRKPWIADQDISSHGSLISRNAQYTIQKWTDILWNPWHIILKSICTKCTSMSSFFTGLNISHKMFLRHPWKKRYFEACKK